MTGRNAEAVYLCKNCVGDKWLAEYVNENGSWNPCNYCGEKGISLNLGDVADFIDSTVQDHFEYVSSEPIGVDHTSSKEGLWTRPGNPVVQVVADMAGVCETISEDIVSILSKMYSVDVQDGGVNLYDNDAYYEERQPEAWRFGEIWVGIIDEIRSRARFFGERIERSLTDVFGDLDAYKQFGGESVIHEITPNDEDRFIWRARKALSREELVAILEFPAREIGPPPLGKASAGRMNASGISVFYGAMDKETCIAEVRPPVGCSIVLARFEILRPVRLLNINALARIDVVESHFDPDYDIKNAKAAFLRNLSHQIGKPVMPQDESLGYLPTQVVAEYLAHRVKPRIDGIMFESSQIKGGHDNVVLFHHACSVDLDGPSEGADVEIDSEIYGAKMIMVTEGTASGKEKKSSGAGNHLPTNEKRPYLRLDSDSVAVLDIEGVQYRHDHWELIRT